MLPPTHVAVDSLLLATHPTHVLPVVTGDHRLIANVRKIIIIFTRNSLMDQHNSKFIFKPMYDLFSESRLIAKNLSLLGFGIFLCQEGSIIFEKLEA